MQTWIRANIGKLIARITAAETAIGTPYENENDLDYRVTAAETAVSSLDDRMDFITAGANHNAIFGGRDLTNMYTVDEMYEMIHSGDFGGLYVGDYFTVSITTDIYTHFTGETFESGTVYYEMSGTINDRVWTETEDETPQNNKTYATKLTKTENVDLMFAGFDYYYNMGDNALDTHHAVLIPKTAFVTTAKMNPTNTATGGYYNSDMHQITLPCYAKSLKTALNNHLLSHKTWLTTTVTGSSSSAAAWVDTELQLMNELQIYGSVVWASSGFEIGIDNEKLPVFNFTNPVRYGRKSSWLRTVTSASYFGISVSTGYTYIAGASNSNYVQPLILFG